MQVLLVCTEGLRGHEQSLYLCPPQAPVSLRTLVLDSFCSWKLASLSVKPEIPLVVVFQLGSPGSAGVKNPPASARHSGVDPWVGETPWRRKWQPTPVFLPGENPMDRRPWRATVYGVAESRTWLKMHVFQSDEFVGPSSPSLIQSKSDKFLYNWKSV